ncbi:MAG: YggS family pyridoxal phosphate-dependent enzyme [Cellvibrio sp.]|nr:YggS family pyridoxal phosphate-dependent enzyme [Cellvibrio sp.]
MQKIDDKLQKVTERITQAAIAAGRNPQTVHLVAVSKTQSADAIRQAYHAGQRLFGENYLQEALDKQQELTDLGELEWHFIGPIQSNKTRPIAEHFAWVHSVDRLKIAQRLNEQRPVNLPPLNICIQLNIDDEASKSGIALNELPELVQAIQTLPRLRLRGLMAIPSVNNSPEQQASAFRNLAEAKARYEFMDCLSMGMSADLEMAIAEGATHVRVGTDIFGARTNA